MGTATVSEQREAAMQAARDVVDTAKTAGRDLSDDEAARVERHLSEVKQLDGKAASAAKSAELVTSLDNMVKAAPESATTTEQTANTLGEHVVKSVGQQIAQAKGRRGFSVSAPEYKAATDAHMTPGYTTPQVDTTVVQQPRTGLTIAGLLGSGAMQASALTYFVEGPAEGAPAAVAEGGAKPQLHYTYSTVTDALSKLAGLIKVSDEMVEDLDFLMTEINNRLLYDLSLTEEQQLLSGDGTAPNLLGLLNREGVQTMGASTEPATGNLDSIFRAVTAVQTGSNYRADGIVVNPADYQTLRLAKDGNQQYYAGGPFVGAYGNAGGIATEPPLWGRPTVVTPAIAAGTVLVGNFAQGGTVYRKGGVRVESTNSHESDFGNNMVTIRAEERLALAVRRPSAFVTLTLGTA